VKCQSDQTQRCELFSNFVKMHDSYRNCPAITEMSMICSGVLIQYQMVTDRWTDGQTSSDTSFSSHQTGLSQAAE